MSPTLSAAEKAQVARLEARPVNLPPLGADGSCPQSPLTTVKPFKNQLETMDLYGSGPVYGAGGPETDTAQNAYFDVTYIADSTVHGLVLVRIETLDHQHQGVFVGKYAVGSLVGSDTIVGKRVDLYGALALPVARPSTVAELGPEWNADLAPGWVAWHVRQGIDRSWKCVDLQIDTDAGTETVVVGA